MVRSRSGLVTVLVAVLTPIGADADDFRFSFTNTTGNVPGTVTGRILGLTDGKTGQAAQVLIDSYPADFEFTHSTIPIDATLFPGQFLNTFTVTSGAITSARFDATSLFVPTPPTQYILNFTSTIGQFLDNTNVPTCCSIFQNTTGPITFTQMPAATPSITSGGVVPAGSSSNAIQPGEWISIYGTNLASYSTVWSGNFPTSLAGTSVTINGKPASLSFVSPGQINLEAPDDPATGAVPVVVTTPSGTATSKVTLAPISPSFLLFDVTHVAGIILRANGAGASGGGRYDIIGPTGNFLGYPTVAAKAGDIIELFAMGLGPTNPTVPAGRVFAGAAPTTNPVTILINNVNVTPAFAGLSGAGLYQINLVVPAGLGTGDVPIIAMVGGGQTLSGLVISLQ